MLHLITERLTLQQIALTDLAEVHDLHCLKEVDQFNTLGIPDSIAITEEILKTWVDMQSVEPRMSYFFVIRLNDTGTFVGTIAINRLKIKFRNAEVSYNLHTSRCGKGYATEALKAVIKFGFEELALHRLEAGCATANFASARVLEKGGFTKEGTKRQILPIRGQWLDAYLFSILEDEYRKACRELRIVTAVKAPVAEIWAAWTNPARVVEWWGPAGFTSTIHIMELREGGEWRLTLHGPDGTNYPNRSVFHEVVPGRKIVFEHFNPGFVTTVLFNEMNGATTVDWTMQFETIEMRDIVVKAHKADEGLKQNMKRLEKYVATILK